MGLTRFSQAARTQIIVRLDQFLGWPPVAQIATILALTVSLIVLWGAAWASYTNHDVGEGLWFALTRFMDGGTMAKDKVLVSRVFAVGVTTTGVLVISFLTGAFASKLGERIDDLRSGRSPVLADDHLLILGFDAKVPLIIRELARSHQRIRTVILAQEDKPRLDAMLRFARRMPRSRLKTVARTGDPRSELALLRVRADSARTILVIAPAKLDDDHALRWCVSTLLAVRRATGPHFRGRVLVEARRSIHTSLLALVGEAGVAGERGLALEIFASDDIVARVLAQSIRQAGVYFALRELLSFGGSELYLEEIPGALVGKSFDDAHALIVHGIAAGVMHADGTAVLAPKLGEVRALSPSDSLIVLEHDRREFTLGRSLPREAHPIPPQPLERVEAKRVLVLGSNRTLPRLVLELDRIMSEGSTVIVSCPMLSANDAAALSRASAQCRSVKIEHTTLAAHDLHLIEDPHLFEADGVVILGCEDELDPDGDASALSILLNLRHARRKHRLAIRRLVTEVRDPAAAQQIAGSADDFLVSTDVVAMVLAQACLEPKLASSYRELLDPTGVEVYLVPRSAYVPDGDATFGEVMAAARRRNEIAIGFYPFKRTAIDESPRSRIELGHIEVDEKNPVYLNPPREMVITAGPEASIVVLADPPDGRSWH